MVMAKASTLFEIMSRDKVDVDELEFHMNKDLHLTKTGGMFVTSIIGNYNIITDEISWVNAGHQPAIIRDNKGNFEEFESKSPPLGVIKQGTKSNYFVNKSKLNGHRFYAFTDGLSESLDKNNKEIGIEGSKEVINRNFSKNPDDELNLIAKEIAANANNKNLSDDLTLIVIGK